jgi:hypothetical protein
MECWITCYQMVLHANGLHWDLKKIEDKLVAGGFSDAPQCRVNGISDEELVKCAVGLKMGFGRTAQINSLAGLKVMLMLCGPLWVAGIFPKETESRVKARYNHVVTIIGVDEELQTVCWVNPWQENGYDKPSKGWISWSYIKESIQSTLHVEASLQYLTPIQAVVLSVI